jgi:hypothetical protein
MSDLQVNAGISVRFFGLLADSAREGLGASNATRRNHIAIDARNSADYATATLSRHPRLYLSAGRAPRASSLLSLVRYYLTHALRKYSYPARPQNDNISNYFPKEHFFESTF